MGLEISGKLLQESKKEFFLIYWIKIKKGVFYLCLTQCEYRKGAVGGQNNFFSITFTENNLVHVSTITIDTPFTSKKTGHEFVMEELFSLKKLVNECKELKSK